MHGPLSAALAAVAMAAGPKPPAVIQYTTGTVIPRFQGLGAAARDQQSAWTEFCARRASADPARLRQAYDGLADAWARIEFVRMGPAETELRAERFNYWLDREDATGRALNAMLSAPDPAALSAQGLKAASVAGQGLPVLERLLYGKDALALLQAPGAPGDRRCAVGVAVAGSLTVLADEMAAGWTRPDGAAEAISANRGWGVSFKDADEASRVMLTNLVGGLENLKDSKVALAFHDEANAGARPLAEDARSGRTQRDVLINFMALRQAVETYTASASPAQKQTIAAGFDAVDGKLRSVSEAQARTPPHSQERQDALKAAIASLADLQQLAMTVVPTVAGVPLGFNNLDGD